MDRKVIPGLRMLKASAAAIVFSLGCAANVSMAQDFPSKPIRLLVGFPPGGNADVGARIVAQKMSDGLGRQVLVENRAGANANIGADYVSKAAPDGYTLLVTGEGPLVINKALDPKLSYDPEAFVPVSVLIAQSLILVSNPVLPAQNLQQLLAYAKANPDKLNLASNGSGSNMHLTLEMLKLATGVKITHVPYKGIPPALTDLVGGQVDLIFVGLGTVQQLLKAGTLRVIAAASERRMALLPDAPTIAESIPGFAATSWFGMVAPPKTPVAIAEKLSGAIREFMLQPDVTKILAELSIEGVGNSPAEMTAFIKQETERWGKVIRATGIKAE